MKFLEYFYGILTERNNAFLVGLRFPSPFWFSLDLNDFQIESALSGYVFAIRMTGRQWAEICFVPSKRGPGKKGPEYRYLATREELKQTELPGMEKSDAGYCFPVMRIQNQRYKVFGIVTNMDWAGDILIPWLYQRCGKSEEAHAAMKSAFAGGKFPSGDFGENAVWWLSMVLSHNLNVLMKRLVLGDSWITKRMKAIRFGFSFVGRVEQGDTFFAHYPSDNHENDADRA